MGDMTFAQIGAEIRANIGGRTDLDSRFTRFINWAHTRIALYHSFTELEYSSDISTVAETEYVDAPDYLRAVVSLRLMDGTNSRKLLYVPERAFDSMIPDASSYVSGVPTHYFIWDNKIYLYRIPDAVYTLKLRYMTWPTPIELGKVLILGDAEVAIGDDAAYFNSNYSEYTAKDEVIVAYATAACLRSLKDLDGYKYWYNEAEKLLAAAVKCDIGSQPDRMDITESGPLVKGDYWLDPFVRSVR